MEKEVKLPNFLIVGAAKSGTTSLYHYLKQHPEIFMPANKEPCFFTFADSGVDEKDDFLKRREIIKHFEAYCDLFKKAAVTQVIGEASTSYLFVYKETIENIKKYHPKWRDLKIIIILRNPIERAFSHYLNDFAVGWTGDSFDDIMQKWESGHLPKFKNYIDYGFYSAQIRAFRDNFEHIKIFLFDDFRKDSKKLIQELFDFLNVNPFFNPETDIKYNVSRVVQNQWLQEFVYKPNILKKIVQLVVPKSVRISYKNKLLNSFAKDKNLTCSQRDMLRNLYKKEIYQLQELLKRNLTHWLA